MKYFLSLLGKHGALVVISGVLIGIIFPTLADYARPELAIAIFVFTFGSFLKLDLKTLRSELANVQRNSLIVLWATFGIPLLMILALKIFNLPAELSQGLLYWSLVPISPATVAFATILGLNPSIALIGTVISTALSPFYIPVIASLVGQYHLRIDPVAMSSHLVFLIGGAFAAASIVKVFVKKFISDHPEAITGISVAAMFLAGMGSMRGMQAHILSQPLFSVEYIALAYLLLFFAEIIGSTLFWSFGRTQALTAGLISGTRTITLAWVILGDDVMPLADLFLAAAMIAKYTAPGLTKWLLSYRRDIVVLADESLLGSAEPPPTESD